MRRAGFTVLALAVTIALGACNLSDDSRVAVTRDEPSGQVAVVAVPCSGEHVEVVQLWTTRTDADGYYVRDRLLWRVEADVPNPQDRFVAGTTPERFREVVPLTRPVEGELLVRVRLSGGWGADEQYVSAADLQTDSLRRDGTTVTLERMREEAEDCGDTPLGADAEMWIGGSVLAWFVWMFVAGLGVAIAALVSRRRRSAQR